MRYLGKPVLKLASFLAGLGLLAISATAQINYDELPPQEPTLRIETEMHTAPIVRVGVDKSCKLMLTGSDDKTARLWDINDEDPNQLEPRLLHVLRVPIGPGNHGKIYAVALSPDGKIAAAGGYNRTGGDHWVYLFDTASGKMIGRLGRLPNVVYHIAYSPDGKYIAATLGGGRGMRIWETSNWSMVASDDNYGNYDSYGATFDENNVLFTVADDGLIRRYGRGFRLELKAQVTAGQRPFQIAANAAADLLAVAFDGNLGIELFSKSALEHQGVVDTQGMEGDLSTVAWSPDGERLFAGGKYVSGGSRPVVIWGDQGKGSRREAIIGRSTVMHILPCENRVVAGSADPAIGTYTGVGIPLLHRENVIVDQRGKREDSFLVSEDGSRVRFGLGYGADIPVIFDLKQRELIDAPSIDPSLSRAITDGLNITNWYDEFTPMLNGEPIEMQNAERSRSLAITRDQKHFVLGTEYRLRGFTAEGEQLWERSMPGVTWGVNIAGNGKVVVVACGDGTVRWYRVSDGTELLTLFVHAKDRRWVAWTPQGYYLASPGAEDLIGWHINRGWTQEADFFPANRFRDTFNRPDVVTRVLLTLDENAAVQEANEKTNRRHEQQDILNKLPPVINILSPTNGGEFGRPEIQIKYTVRSPSGLPVKRIRALVDGRPIEVEARGLEGIRGKDTELTLTMPVPPRDATVALIAETEGMSSEPAEVVLRWSGSATVTDKPDLYAVLVGVNDYADGIIPDLKWAENDAGELANVLRAQEGTLYDRVDVRLLTGPDASAGAILDNLDWISRASSPGDRVIVFLAGHGVTDERQDYYYLAQNAEIDQSSGLFVPRRSTAIKRQDIIASLRETQGHALFLFDTCHSSRATSNPNETRIAMLRNAPDLVPFINELRSAENGVLVLSSSEGRESSQERDEWKHGAFTKAILEALRGYADGSPADSVITFSEMNAYVGERVKELTANRQHPVLHAIQPSRDLPVAVVRQ